MQMKKMNVFTILVSTAMLLALCSGTYAQDAGKTIDTRIGKLSFTHDFANGYPTHATRKKLFNEMDFQRATQAYLWAIPIVSMAQWQWSFENTLGAQVGDIVYYPDHNSKLGILTANTTTPYVTSFADLQKIGPLVIDIPEGQVRGMLTNMWQIEFSYINGAGKYLVHAPGTKAPAVQGYKTVEATTNNFMFGLRLMSPDAAVRDKLLDAIKVYPYKDRANPRPTKVLRKGGERLIGITVQPRGITYYERLADILNREVVDERDRFFHAMLQPLGIEKGKPFKPTASQKKILSQAALVGEAMAKANDFYNPRIKASIYREGSAWEIATTSPANQRWKNYDALDGRAAWFYEALTNGPAMNSQKPGWGQKYLASYLDSDKDWLDGARSYKLHVPADVPAAAFWSLTVYDVSSRCPIDNKTKQADRSSRMELLKNSDGSIDLYFGPEAPNGKEKNWVQTVKGKSWFPYFRLYSPTERFFDQSWILPDIEKAK